MAWLGNRAGLRRAVGIFGIIAVAILSSACADGSSTSQTTAKHITGTVLGGPAQAFIAKYGPLVASQSNTTAGELHFQQYPGADTDALVVYTGKNLALSPGDNDVAMIFVSQAPGQVWRPAEAKTACTSFIPADAKSVRSSADNVSPGMGSGHEDIYTSAMLAKTFPAYAFPSADAGTAPAGTFNIWYSDAFDGDSSTFRSCMINLGELPQG